MALITGMTSLDIPNSQKTQEKSQISPSQNYFELKSSPFSTGIRQGKKSSEELKWELLA